MSLLSLAVEAADTAELAATAAVIMSRCHAAGLAPDAYRCVIGAMVNLGAVRATGGRAWGSDREYLGALIDLECELFTKLQHVNSVMAQVQAAAANTPNTRENAVTIATLQAAAEVLAPARARVTAALNRVIAAPDELTEAYAACYRHVRAGLQLPYRGRFISGELGGDQ